MENTATRALTYRYAFLIGMLELAIAVPMPVLVLHMSGRGLDLAIIGLAFTIRAVLVVLLELPTGGLADAIGRRPVALASQLFTAASFLALLFVTGPFLALAYALLQGIGAALHSGALDAWYVDELKRAEPDVELQPHLATVNVFQAVGMLTGTVLGGFLPRLVAGLELPFPLSDFGIALFAGVALRVVVWLLTFTLMKEPVKPQGADPVGVAAVPKILKEAFGLSRTIPQVRWLLIAAAASGLAMVSIETFWQPIAAFTFGAEASNSVPYGILGTLSGIALLGGSLLVMRWGKDFPGGPAALAGFSTMPRRGHLRLRHAEQLGRAGGHVRSRLLRTGHQQRAALRPDARRHPLGPPLVDDERPLARVLRGHRHSVGPAGLVGRSQRTPAGALASRRRNVLRQPRVRRGSQVLTTGTRRSGA